MSTFSTIRSNDQLSCESYFMSPATGETYFYLLEAGARFELATLTL